MNYQDLLPQLDLSRLPRHVGIIMDGNGRWAKLHHRPRLYGHRAGSRALRQVVELGVELKLGFLTFYTFSTENWSREQAEVQGLLRMFKELLIKEIGELHRQNIVVRILGSETELDPKYLTELRKVASVSHQNTGLTLNLAFNYGGRREILEAVQKIGRDALRNPEMLDKLDSETFSRYLYTSGQPDPDLIIRTSGERRLSNFLLWQSAYAEIYITDTLWPDFGKVEMLEALIDFQSRQRRFGGRKPK